MIDIDGKHSVGCKNGYYTVRFRGEVKSGVKKGEMIQLWMKTYATIFGAWDKLKELGVNSDTALLALEKAKDEDVVVITKEALAKRRLNHE